LLLELRDITKRYGDVVANDRVSLVVSPKSIHAIVGENGAGKSTLMNVLYGMTTPNSGEIFVDGTSCRFRRPQDAIAKKIGMVHQDFLLIPRFTVAENVILGMREGVGTKKLFRTDLRAASLKIRALAEEFGLGVDPDASVAALSVGVQQRVEILKLLYRDADLLILDEPTGVLTPQESEGLFEVLKSLKRSGKSILVITHKLNEVINHTDMVTVMRAGKDVLHGITKNMTSDILAEAMVGERPDVRLQRQPIEPLEDALEVRDITFSDGRGVTRLRNVSLRIRKGEVLGIAGVDGNGQNELAEIVSGIITPNCGDVLFSGRSVIDDGIAERRKLGMAYIPADRRKVGSIHELSLAENTALGRLSNYVSRSGFLRRRLLGSHAKQLITDYQIRAPNAHFTAGNLSGGNLQKLILGREMFDSPTLIIVEQPTRGLDIRASNFVRQTILKQRLRGVAVLLISADLDEVLALSDAIAVMYEGEIVGQMENENIDLRRLGLLMAGVHT